MSHTGIRVRITCSAGTLLDADSDMLNAVAAMRGQGWSPLAEDLIMSGDIKIEIMPAELPDSYPDE